MKQTICWLTALVLLWGCAGSLAEEQMKGSDGAEDQAEVMAIVERVNINEADAETIAAALHRVGVKRAQAIVQWREANGKFTSVDQLLEIKGIGEVTLENNRDRILL